MSTNLILVPLCLAGEATLSQSHSQRSNSNLIRGSAGRQTAFPSSLAKMIFKIE